MLPGDLVKIKITFTTIGLVICKVKHYRYHVNVLVAGKVIAFHEGDLEIIDENYRPSWY